MIEGTTDTVIANLVLELKQSPPLGVYLTYCVISLSGIASVQNTETRNDNGVGLPRRFAPRNDQIYNSTQYLR